MQLSFFLNPGRLMLESDVKRNLERLEKGPVANEKDLYDTYDHAFDHNTGGGIFARNYAVKIYKMLLCCKESPRLYEITSALALDDGAEILGLTRDFTYLTRSDELKFAHVSAIDYLRNHRPDHEEYSDASCHAEMALICIKGMTSPVFLGDPSRRKLRAFPAYASSYWVEHCAQSKKEGRESRGVSQALFGWLVKDAGKTTFYRPFCKVPGIKVAMITASICNFVDLGLEVIQSRLSAHESLPDLLSAEDIDDFPPALRNYIIKTRTDIIKTRTGYRAHWTPLIWATAYGNGDMVDLLLKHDKISDAQKPNDYRIALTLAATNGYEMIVEKFLSLGERINFHSPNSDGQTPVSRAAQRGQLGTVQLLLRFGADPNEPLLMAACRGHLDIVKLLLLEKRVDCNHRGNVGRTPLSYAAQGSYKVEGDLEMVQLLITKGAELESKDHSGRTPLSYAAQKGTLEMVQLLITKGAELESKDHSGRTPLSYAAQRSYRVEGDLEMVQLLIANGAKLESKDRSGRTPLSHAAECNTTNIVQQLLDSKADLESKDHSNRTPLIYAAGRGNLKIVQLLLKSGADLELKDKHNRTPLLYAASDGSLETIQLLLEYRADPGSKDVSGRTPLSYAAERWCGAEDVRIDQLLLDFGADPESKDVSGRTPLSYAACRGSLETIQLLLKSGADPGSEDSSRRTPLLYAARRGNPEIIQLLLNSGGNIELKDDSGRTPLSYAAASSSLKIIQLFLESGADPRSEDSSTRTPLSYARGRIFANDGDNPKIIQLLLEYGADPGTRNASHRTSLS